MPEKKLCIILLMTILIIPLVLSSCSQWLPLLDREPANSETGDLADAEQVIALPEPILQGRMSLEETLLNRRSVRAFEDTPLTEAQIGQLLWSAQGITTPSGLRTAPSAGARYPLEIYAATPEGLFHYHPQSHSLVRLLDRDPRHDLYQAAIRQTAVRDAPLVFVISAVFQRTAERYGEARTPQYVFLEAGHAAQNIHLQAVALELGSVPIGAFHEDQISQALSLPADEVPIYLIPVGYPEQ